MFQVKDSGRVAEEKAVSVMVPVAVEAPYTYRAPKNLPLQPGDIVEVPLGTRDVVGIVWDDPPDPEIGHNRLRAVTGKFDAPPIPEAVRRFVDWVANYTLTQRGMVARMVLRAPGALEPARPLLGVRRAGPEPERMTAARRRVLDQFDGDLAWSKSGLAAACGVSASVVQGLIDAGTLEIVMLPPEAAAPAPDPDFGTTALTDEQGMAVQVLRDAVAAGAFSVTLLDGITGSGKTEVYLEAVAASVKRGSRC
jgi:primosomal protein N' (replication factor Y)